MPQCDRFDVFFSSKIWRTERSFFALLRCWRHTVVLTAVGTESTMCSLCGVFESDLEENSAYYTFMCLKLFEDHWEMPIIAESGHLTRATLFTACLSLRPHRRQSWIFQRRLSGSTRKLIACATIGHGEPYQVALVKRGSPLMATSWRVKSYKISCGAYSILHSMFAWSWYFRLYHTTFSPFICIYLSYYYYFSIVNKYNVFCYFRVIWCHDPLACLK